MMLEAEDEQTRCVGDKMQQCNFDYGSAHSSVRHTQIHTVNLCVMRHEILLSQDADQQYRQYRGHAMVGGMG